MASEDEKEEGFNPRRRLCPDGSCIGIIGSDGKCTVCARIAPEGPGATSEEQSFQGSDNLPEDDVDDVDDTASTNRDEPGFDPQRRLCSDGACIGVIGSDNRCSECGKPANG